MNNVDDVGAPRIHVIALLATRIRDDRKEAFTDERVWSRGKWLELRLLLGFTAMADSKRTCYRRGNSSFSNSQDEVVQNSGGCGCRMRSRRSIPPFELD